MITVVQKDNIVRFGTGWHGYVNLLHINAKLYFIDELYEIVNKSIFKDYERANLLKCETLPTVLIPKYYAEFGNNKIHVDCLSSLFFTVHKQLL